MHAAFFQLTGLLTYWSLTHSPPFPLTLLRRQRKPRGHSTGIMKNTSIALVSFCAAVALFSACQTRRAPGSAELKVVPTANDTNASIVVRPASGALGTIERLDPALDELLPKGAIVEKLAEGFDWSEGPVWMPAGYLLFSDVPLNTIFKWTPRGGVTVHLQPSGYTGSAPRGGEPGSNGLTHDKQGRLIACQHGDRRVARWENGRYVAVADRFDGKRFNSPNDVVVKSNGDIYFTDPPYGLVGNVDDPSKEIPFQGVYRVGAEGGKVTVLTKEVTRPNGLAFSPDEKILYVASSDPKKAIWMAYPVKEDGTLGEGRVFFDATDMQKGRKGLPDGLKVDNRGNLWATGPGGVLIFSPAGKHLGTLATGEATGNCAWGDDGSTLYITADMYLGRVKTKVKGAGL
jgi:gluconolactonase